MSSGQKGRIHAHLLPTLHFKLSVAHHQGSRNSQAFLSPSLPPSQTGHTFSAFGLEGISTVWKDAQMNICPRIPGAPPASSFAPLLWGVHAQCLISTSPQRSLRCQMGQVRSSFSLPRTNSKPRLPVHRYVLIWGCAAYDYRSYGSNQDILITNLIPPSPFLSLPYHFSPSPAFAIPPLPSLHAVPSVPPGMDRFGDLRTAVGGFCPCLTPVLRPARPRADIFMRQTPRQFHDIVGFKG